MNSDHIEPAPADDREIAGINQATCEHDWKPNNIFQINPLTGRRYQRYTHCCQRCWLFGVKRSIS